MNNLEKLKNKVFEVQCKLDKLMKVPSVLRTEQDNQNIEDMKVILSKAKLVIMEHDADERIRTTKSTKNKMLVSDGKSVSMANKGEFLGYKENVGHKAKFSIVEKMIGRSKVKIVETLEPSFSKVEKLTNNQVQLY